MLLTDAEIQKRNIIQGAITGNYRDTGYDLAVGLIIDTKGQDHANQYMIGGSGIVEVISEETLHIPLNVTGFAHVKTSMVESGLLPLNIGIIDPGWNGKLSATLLNFGDGPGRLIQKGDIFLRLTFIEHAQSQLQKPTPIAAAEYIKIKRKKISQNFGETFLGWDRFRKTLNSEIDGKLKDSEARVLPSRVSAMIGLVALALVLVQLAGTYFVAVDPFHWIGRQWEDVPSKERVDTIGATAKSALLAAATAAQQIQQMRTEIQALSASQSHPTSRAAKPAPEK